MTQILKRAVKYLPASVQDELKRLWFAQQLLRGTFKAEEAEYQRLAEWVRAGDWALDVGANVGHYSVRLSELVSTTGRVLAFEPVPATFALLSANVNRIPLRNVSLFNAAASEETQVLGMRIPKFETGLVNYYQAEVTSEPAQLTVLAIAIDDLHLPRRVALVKIDVEGHELSVLKGMKKLLSRDHPALIVEGRSPEVASYLAGFEYVFEEASTASPNRVFVAAGDKRSRT